MRWLAYLQEFHTVSVGLRLVLAAFLGGLIGMERSSHGRPAGLRTFSLVCLGSAIAMVTDEYLVEVYQTGDPARLAAQVISGIGFLGVGTIIVTGKNYVKGLTTAASLWATACLGIAIGSGYILGGLISFSLILFVITVLTRISHHIDDNTRSLRLYLEADKTDGVKALYQFTNQYGYKLSSIEKQKRSSLQGKDVVLIVQIDMKKRRCHGDILRGMNAVPAFHYIEEIR